MTATTSSPSATPTQIAAMIADSGAARRIAISLINGLGPARIPVAMTITGFVVGLPLYYNVGFVLMIPLIFSMVQQSGRPAVALGMPLLSGLSIAHGFLPPHPSATALVAAVHADMGTTLVYGLMVAIPTLIIAGPVFSMSLRHIRGEPAAMFRTTQVPDDQLPGAFNSFATALLPVVLLAGLTLITLDRPVPEARCTVWLSRQWISPRYTTLSRGSLARARASSCRVGWPLSSFFIKPAACSGVGAGTS